MNWMHFDWPGYDDISNHEDHEALQPLTKAPKDHELVTQTALDVPILLTESGEAPFSSVLEDPSPGNILEVITTHIVIDNHDASYTLPLKQNRGKPPN